VSYLAGCRHLYERFNAFWGRVRRELEALGQEHGLPVYATGAGSLIGLHFTTERPTEHRTVVEGRWSEKVYELYHLYMRLKGILYLPKRSSSCPLWLMRKPRPRSWWEKRLVSWPS